MPTCLHLPATSRCDSRLQVMAQRQELRHLFTKSFGGKGRGEIFPPLSWRNSGFRAYTKLTRASPTSHSLPPRSHRRTQTCERFAGPTARGPVRPGSTAGLCAGKGGPGAQTPAGSQRDPPVARPHRRPPPAQGAAGFLSGGVRPQPHQPRRGSETSPKAPHRGRARQGPRRPRTRREPRTHRRRRLLRPPAPQQQHQAAGDQAAALPPRLHPARSGAPGPALRHGHSPAGQRGSLQAAPTGCPDASVRPSAALARFSRPKSSRDYSIPPLRGRARRTVRGTLLLLPPPSEGTTIPPPFPRAPRFCRLDARAPPLPAPHLHRAGSWTPDYFLQRKPPGCVGGRGELLAVPGRPSGGAGGGRGARLAEFRPIRPRSGATPRQGPRKLPARARYKCLEGLRRRGKRAVTDPSGQRRRFQPGRSPGARRPRCSVVRGKEPAKRPHRALPAPSDGGPSSSSGGRSGAYPAAPCRSPRAARAMGRAG